MGQQSQLSQSVTLNPRLTVEVLRGAPAASLDTGESVCTWDNAEYGSNGGFSGSHYTFWCGGCDCYAVDYFYKGVVLKNGWHVRKFVWEASIKDDAYARSNTSRPFWPEEGGTSVEVQVFWKITSTTGGHIFHSGIIYIEGPEGTSPY